MNFTEYGPRVIDKLSHPFGGAALQENSRNVLIVEDDIMAFHRLSSLLRAKNHRVLPVQADNLDSAKALLKERRDINLVICDQFLTGEDRGIALWQYCQNEFPDMPFLMTSGADLESFYNIAESEIAPPFLHKPFTNEEVWKTVRQLVSTQRQELPKQPNIMNVAVTGLLSVLLLSHLSTSTSNSTLLYKQNLIKTEVDKQEILPVRTKEFMLTPPARPTRIQIQRPPKLQPPTLRQVTEVGERVLKQADEIIIESRSAGRL